MRDEQTAPPTEPRSTEDPGSAERSGDADGVRPGEDARRRAILAVALAATFMAMMDSYIVNVAIPSIRADLHASTSSVEMTVGGYLLAYGLFLVTGGRLGDILGFKRMFLLGLALFTAASLACGAAPDPAALVVFRCVQGFAAALFFPQILSIIQTVFDGARRDRALALFGVTIGLAAISGQLIGGLLLHADVFGWHWRPIFLVNLPVGLLTLIGAALALPGADGTKRARLDLRGVGLLTVALLLLSFPLAEGESVHWPTWCVVMPVLSLPFFAVFAVWERHVAARGGQPLVSPRLVRLRGFRSGNAVFVAFFASNAGLFFILAIQLQSGLGYSALESGLLFAPLGTAFTAVSLFVPKIAAKMGLRVLTLGYSLNAAGYLVLLITALAAGDRLDGPILIPALVIIGIGQGLGVSPLLGTALAEVPPTEVGAAAGVLETVGQLGMSLGIALVGLLFFSALNAQTSHHAYAHAFTVTLVLNLALAILAVASVPSLTKAAATASEGSRVRPT